jgi:membrane protease YdiL (CAAX protease family)
MTRWFSTLFTRLAAPESPPPWRTLDVIITSIVLLGAFFLVGPVITLAIVGDPATQPAIAPLVGWIIGGILTLAYLIFIQRYDSAALKLGETPISLPFIMLFGLAVAVTLDVLGLLLTGQIIPATELINAARFDSFGWILAFAFMVIIQPITEELIFRGVLLPTLRARIGSWLGLLISILIYGLFHLLAYTPGSGLNGYALIVPFLAGLIFGMVRVYTDSTRAAIITHLAFGLFMTLKALTLAG